MILLEKMDIDDAKNIFGISTIPNAVDLKTMWKDLAKKNHPDFGGNADKMKDINAAYDLLSSYAGSGDSSSYGPSDWAEREDKQEAKNKAFFAMAENFFDKSFDEKRFKEYISDFVTDDLTVNIKKATFPKASFAKYYDVPYRVEVELSNADNTTVIYLSYYIEIGSGGGGLGYSGIDMNEVLFEIAVQSNIYFGKRKFKVSQSNWKWRAGTKTLSNYEELFPKAKMKKIFATDTSTRAFKKKDMMLGLERELDVRFNNDDIYIYFFGKKVEYYLIINRIVMMRTPMYMFGMTYGKRKVGANFVNRFSNKVEPSWYETEENLNKLVKAVINVSSAVGDIDVDNMSFDEMNEVFKIIEKEMIKEFPYTRV
jgi:hypothetical protein